MNTRRNISALFALATALLVGSPALAQRPVGNGRALDRNLQVGSGGVNGYQVPNDYGKYAQSIVTGNVGGLGSFRGDLNYGSSSSFGGRRGTVGGDDLFRFRAQSYLASPDTIRQQYSNPLYSPTSSFNGPSAAGTPGNANSAIILPSTAATFSGQATGQYNPAGSSLPSVNLGNSTYRLTNNNASLFNESSLPYSAASQPPLAVGTNDAGQLVQMNASPLTGLTMTQSPASQLFTRYSNEARAAGVQPAMNPALPTNTAPLLPQTAPDSTNSTTIPNVTQSSPIDYRASALPFAPGQLLGQQIAAAPDQRLNTSVNAQVNAVNSNLANITASATAQPGEDVYLDLLRRINLTESTVPQVAQIEPSQSSQQIPSATQPDAAVSVPSVPKPGETPESPNQPSPTANPKVEQLIQKLNYQMPALSTMAGTTESQLNNALARAEKLMAEGKYFIAESTYESALNLRPGYPLAVVGRANAQIGAGMFLSAGNTLHDLFSEHPELIATQYTQPVLPPADRLSIIEDQLTSLINKNSNDPQLPLVLAYIAYQQNRPDLIQHALELMRQRSAADRLIPLLRRLWLDTPTPDRNATSTPPATQP